MALILTALAILSCVKPLNLFSFRISNSLFYLTDGFTTCIFMERGERIKKRREELGISQADLARMLSKTRSLISHIEKTGKVNDLTYFEIMKALEMPVEIESDLLLVKRVEQFKGINSRENNLEVEFLAKENSSLKQIIELQRAVIELLKNKK